MTKLTTLSCVACSGESPLATPEEIDTLRLQVPEWNILISEGVGKLERVFEFSDFIQALEFTNNVGNLAEQENHHPALLTEWGGLLLLGGHTKSAGYITMILWQQPKLISYSIDVVFYYYWQFVQYIAV